MIDMTYARRAFDAYLDQFDRTDEKIRLKIVHTDGVVRYMTEICRRMNLPEEDCRLAELSGIRWIMRLTACGSSSGSSG